MKEEIYELKDMTDSREMMEGKESPFIRMFIVILFVLTVAAIVFGCLFKVDEYTSLAGEVIVSETSDAGDGKLEIVIYIPESEYSNVREGQDTEYSFTAIPYSKFGKGHGKITHLDKTPTIDEQSGIRYYIATAELEEGSLSNSDTVIDITKGMTVKVRVISETETAMHWLIKKIT